MKRLTTVIGLAAVAAMTMPLTATARPASAQKPTGTIFYFRENARHNGQNVYSMTGAGHKMRRVGHVQEGTQVYAASAAHLLIYTHDISEFKRSLVVASYTGKPTHIYRPRHLVNVLSVSPNGKYIGMQTAGAGDTSDYEIATIKGKVVAKLFNADGGVRGITESWNAKSNQIALLNTSEESPQSSSSLKIYNLRGKVVRTLVKNTGGASSLAWSPSGQVAYSVSNQIDVVPDAGGTPKVLYNARPDFPTEGLSYSPNGAFLSFGLFVVGNTSTVVQQVWRVTAKGKHPTKVTGNGTLPDWG